MCFGSIGDYIALLQRDGENFMASIVISDLRPAGSELFMDSESFLSELSDGELSVISGGEIFGSWLDGFIAGAVGSAIVSATAVSATAASAVGTVATLTYAASRTFGNWVFGRPWGEGLPW